MCFSINKVLFPAEKGVKPGLKHFRSDAGNWQPCSFMRRSHQGGNRSLGWDNPLEKEMAKTHSGIPAWEIPWTDEPGWLVYGVAKRRGMTDHMQKLLSLIMSHLFIFAFISNILGRGS